MTAEASMTPAESQALMDLASDDEEVNFCLHYQEKKDLEKKMELLSSKQAEVLRKIAKIESQLEDFEDFFNQFGEANQLNSASQMIEAENETKWHEYYCLGEESVDLNSEIYDTKQHLRDIEKQALDEKCFCKE